MASTHILLPKKKSLLNHFNLNDVNLKSSIASVLIAFLSLWNHLNTPNESSLFCRVTGISWQIYLCSKNFSSLPFKPESVRPNNVFSSSVIRFQLLLQIWYLVLTYLLNFIVFPRFFLSWDKNQKENEIIQSHFISVLSLLFQYLCLGDKHSYSHIFLFHKCNFYIPRRKHRSLYIAKNAMSIACVPLLQPYQL